MEDINLHFTGDIHAITAANNLLAAMIDNHIKQGNELHINPQSICWRRCLDLNDRALRNIEIAMGGSTDGLPRRDGFDISVASEIMAILCLAEDINDLKKRLSGIIIGKTYDGKYVTAGEIKAVGAMAALLKDAVRPNLVQTLAKNAGAGTRRPLCQHCPRLQQSDCDQNSAAAGRLCCNRSRVRRRFGRGKVL